MRTIALNNLGCSKNVIDGEAILGSFGHERFTLVTEFEKADIIIVNTCTFIREATQEAIDTILEMARYKKTGVCTMLIVSGCFSQRYREQVKDEFPEVDLWLGVQDWQQELRSFFNTRTANPVLRVLTPPVATQYLKLSEGCSHACTYCIIPSIRGVFKSRAPEEIMTEARWLYEQGVRECILISQDTSFYGRDRGLSLAYLLEMLLKKTSFPWIRMMYLHPRYVDDDLLSLVASEKRLCPYFDIPLQHASRQILKKMNRAPTDPRQLNLLIDRIRTLVPDATIRTTVIAGFPGETDGHFRQLLRFIEKARFDKLGVFPYSPEEGTKAYAMKPRPKNHTALKRCEIIMDLQKMISREICAAKIGSVTEVIIDSVCENHDFSFEARTRGDAPEIDGRVFIRDGRAAPGDFKQVTIADADDYDLFANLFTDQPIVK